MKKNKKVIRRENVAGKFTTVHHSILNDTRLSSTDFRILVSILSDADHFNLTLNLLVNRFGIDVNTVRKSLKNLAICGYMKIIQPERGRGNLYTISEFGNLNSSLETVPSENKSKEEQFPITEAIEQTKPIKTCNNKPIGKSKVSTISLVSIKKQYKNAELFDAILPFAQANAGGHMISNTSKDNIIRRTMIKFIGADSNLTEGEVSNYILTIKGDYSKAGQLDQKYQN